MRVSYRWLKDYVDFEFPPQGLADRLTAQGLNVDCVEERRAAFNGVVVGRVLEVAWHPNADKLRVCTVDVGTAGEPQPGQTGGRVRQIVCGAPNVAVGQHVSVALPGAQLPGGVVIQSRTLRGVVSDGMICSARELGLPDDTGGAGIMVLPEFPVGADLAEVLNLNDAVIVLDLTPNYAMHCQSMLGVAREVSVFAGTRVREPVCRLVEGGEPAGSQVCVHVMEPRLCRRYAAMVIRGVRVGPSPHWVRQRLKAAGMRPINNVVDATNYVMLEYGQPLHAFDLQRLRSGERGLVEVIVRLARKGERITCLDGADRQLSENDLVISDVGGPIAIAGVMGGQASGVTEETVDILLESAHFDSLSVRRTARRLGLRSEAAARFEKWVDPEGCVAAARRAAAMICELAGGVVQKGVVDCYPEPVPPKRIRAKTGRINGLLGLSLAQEEIMDILGRLGLGVRGLGDGEFEVTVPSRRADIEGEADLAEEVARVYGYDRIPTAMPASPVAVSPVSKEQVMIEKARSVCLSAGLTEVMTFSFMNPRLFDLAGFGAEDPARKAIPIANPLTEEQGVMRTSLIPLLLDAASANCRHRQVDIAIFEIGRVYHPKQLILSELPDERLVLGILMTGSPGAHNWQEPPREADFFALKGVVEAICERLLISDVGWRAASRPGFHPGRTAELVVLGEALGIIGEVHPAVQEAFAIPGRTYVAEVDLENLVSRGQAVPVYRAIPRHPSIQRDLAFILPQTVPAETAREVMMEAGKPLLHELRLFDVYSGGQVPHGHRSLAYSLIYLDPERTLTDAEVDAVHDRVREALRRIGAGLRS